jgi:hypothetical protein
MSVVKQFFYKVGRTLEAIEKESFDLAKIEVLIGYIKGLKAVRSILVSAVVILAAALTFVGGMVLIHIGLISLTPEHSLDRTRLLFLLGAIDLAIAAAVFYFFFAEERWMRFSKSEEWMEKLVRPEKDQTNSTRSRLKEDL